MAILRGFSVFALTSLPAACIAFAGCSAGSGSFADPEAGAPTADASKPDTATETDGGAQDSSSQDSGSQDAADSSTPGVCAPNKQMGDLVSAACQAKLNAVCCAELKACFNLVVPPGGGATDDCNVFASCVDLANGQPTPAEQQAAQAECDLGAPMSVRDAYDAIVACATNKANAECQ